jgi:hypothetical protein
MNAVEVLAQGDRYLQHAVNAEGHAVNAYTDSDRAVWLFMAKGWLSLLPLIEGPGTQPKTSDQIPLVERLDRLRRLRAACPESPESVKL